MLALENLSQAIFKAKRLSVDFEIIALMEANRIMARFKENDRDSDFDDWFPKACQSSMPIDMRIVLSWDADNTDIDLHIIDPLGEEVYYGHNKSKIGGSITRDVTNGYGPEGFVLKKAIDGEYIIKAKYYGSRQQKKLGPIQVKATVYTRFSSAEEVVQELVFSLKNTKETVTIGTIEFKSQ